MPAPPAAHLTDPRSTSVIDADPHCGYWTLVVSSPSAIRVYGNPLAERDRCRRERESVITTLLHFERDSLAERSRCGPVPKSAVGAKEPEPTA